MSLVEFLAKVSESRATTLLQAIAARWFEPFGMVYSMDNGYHP
jgi:hypothetical protein